MEKKQGKMKEQKKSYSNEEEEEGEERKETKKKEQKDEREEAGKRNATFCVSVIVEVSSYLLWFSDSVLGCSMAFTVGSWWFKVVLKRWAATVAGWAVFFPAHWPTAAQKYVPRSLDHAVFYHKAKELAEKKKKRRKQKRTRRSCGGSPVRAASFRRWTGAPPPTEASERSSGNDQVHLTNRFTYTHPHTAFQIPRRKSTNYRERERERGSRLNGVLFTGQLSPESLKWSFFVEAFAEKRCGRAESDTESRRLSRKRRRPVQPADRPLQSRFDSIWGKKKYMKRKKTKRTAAGGGSGAARWTRKRHRAPFLGFLQNRNREKSAGLKTRNTADTIEWRVRCGRVSSPFHYRVFFVSALNGLLVCCGLWRYRVLSAGIC